MFYLMTHTTHFIYNHMALDIWYRTTQITRKKTHCGHYTGYSFRLATRFLLYAPFHRQDNTYHGLCYTSRGAQAGTRNSSMGPPLVNALTTKLQGIFYMHHPTQTGQHIPCLCYTSRRAQAGTRNISMGPPWRIDLTNHRTTNRELSTTELHHYLHDDTKMSNIRF